MDYDMFFKDISDWIKQCNNVATSNGMQSNVFWDWVAESLGKLSDKYGNNDLVKRQMTMLWNWLEEIYTNSKGG